MSHYSAALCLDTDTPDFIRGLEVGRLWEMLQRDPATEVAEFVHASNAEMILRLAEATGREVQAQDIDATWLFVTFRPARAPGA